MIGGQVIGMGLLAEWMLCSTQSSQSQHVTLGDVSTEISKEDDGLSDKARFNGFSLFILFGIGVWRSCF